MHKARMDFNIERVRVIESDLSRHRHQEALIELINAYLNDEMGEGGCLDIDTQTRLIFGLIDHSTAFIFFAEYNGKMIGLAICFLGFSTFQAKKLINIHDLIVLPEYRRQGIAKRILMCIEEKAKLMNCCKLTLEVRTDNIKAMGLYKRLGFSSGEYPMSFWRKLL